MKSGIEAYKETQAMAKVDVLEIMEQCYHEMNGYGSFYPLQYELSHARDGVKELIDCARTILRTGFTIEDHQRLQAILEKIA